MMSSAMPRRALQVFLTILGSVAVVSGTVTMLFGVESIIGAKPAGPTADSEMRFFAVWYAGAGVVLLRAVPRVETHSTIVRAVGALFFLAGCGRLISLLVVGKPHQFSLWLMAIELSLPFVIVPWQALVARQPSSR